MKYFCWGKVKKTMELDLCKLEAMILNQVPRPVPMGTSVDL